MAGSTSSSRGDPLGRIAAIAGIKAGNFAWDAAEWQGGGRLVYPQDAGTEVVKIDYRSAERPHPRVE